MGSTAVFDAALKAPDTASMLLSILRELETPSPAGVTLRLSVVLSVGMRGAAAWARQAVPQPLIEAARARLDAAGAAGEGHLQHDRHHAQGRRVAGGEPRACRQGDGRAGCG